MDRKQDGIGSAWRDLQDDHLHDEELAIVIYLFYAMLLLSVFLHIVLIFRGFVEVKYYPIVLRQTLYAEGILCLLISQVAETDLAPVDGILTILAMVFVILATAWRQVKLQSGMPSLSRFRSYTVLFSNLHVYTGPIICIGVVVYSLVAGPLRPETHMPVLFFYITSGVLAIAAGLFIDSRKVDSGVKRTPPSGNEEDERKSDLTHTI